MFPLLNASGADEKVTVEAELAREAVLDEVVDLEAIADELLLTDCDGVVVLMSSCWVEVLVEIGIFVVDTVLVVNLLFIVGESAIDVVELVDVILLVVVSVIGLV